MMKKSLYRYIAVSTVGLAVPVFSLLSFSQEDPEHSAWRVWLGSRYSGYTDFFKKVVEFERGKEGAFQGLALDYSVVRGKNSLDVSGQYYDPWKFSLDVKGKAKGMFSASMSYRSFYRQRETDLLENLMVREAVDQANKPGGKMFTYEHEAPGADFGYIRREVRSDYQVKVPGSANMRFYAAHHFIHEEGNDQKVISMHCSSCHMVSKSVRVDRRTHSVSIGVEADHGPLFVSCGGNYRAFQSDVSTSRAFYDVAEHPTDTTKGGDFGTRTIFDGEVVEFGKIPEIQKTSHTARIQVDVGKRSEVYGSFTLTQAKNVSAGLQTQGNSGNLKYVFRPNVKTRLLALASMTRIESDEVFIDLPLWREGFTGGGQDFDWTRYSSLSCTVAKGFVEGTYQPASAYRLVVSAGYEETKRDDYPYFEADWKTTKLTLSAGGTYRPSLKFSGRLKYAFRNIDNPFSTYEQFFERSGGG